MTEVDDYLAALDPATSQSFARIRDLALEVVPEAEQGKRYGLAALTFRGKGLLGFLAAKQHLSVFPFSPAAVDAVRDHLQGSTFSKGTIRFSIEEPLPDEVIRTIVTVRRDEIASAG
jgi:uncharacterized protein YdhG (YjbR/CyaY superfamily)